MGISKKNEKKIIFPHNHPGFLCQYGQHACRGTGKNLPRLKKKGPLPN